MIHGDHVILPHYGFWLPNDPRGSWSVFVARWELARLGKTTRHLEQRTLAQLSQEELAQREAVRAASGCLQKCVFSGMAGQAQKNVLAAKATRARRGHSPTLTWLSLVRLLASRA